MPAPLVPLRVSHEALRTKSLLLMALRAVAEARRRARRHAGCGPDRSESIRRAVYDNSPPGCDLFRIEYPVCAKITREVCSECTAHLGSKKLSHFAVRPGLAAAQHGAKHLVINGLQRRSRILGHLVLLI
jgi:hypothetical protein